MFNRIGMVFAGIGALTVIFIVLYVLYWEKPEKWNTTANSYLAHAVASDKHIVLLKADSVGKLGRIDSLKGVIVRKDTIIARLSREARKALDFGNTWKGNYQTAVAASDANTDLLTDQQMQLDYYKALLKSLPASSIPSARDIQGASPIVIKAGLKTANKLNISTATIDTLSRTVGYLQAANQRLGTGLSRVSQGLSSLSQQAKANQKGGIPILRHRRVKQNKAIQKTADSLKAIIEDVSGLEKILNQKL